ncbi:MAG: NADH-quinone oxidoreductase subunit L [Phycisphaerales bacterium]|nr:NADH-quinone oxidoreductase subunit L [Phycisphaerales bacterium]
MHTLLAQLGHASEGAPMGAPQTIGAWTALIPLLPLIASVACGVLAFLPSGAKTKRAAWCCIAGLALSFVLSVVLAINVGHGLGHASIFEWIRIDRLKADFAFYLDPLTSIMLIVVTGIGTLVAVYASEYMWGDRGYARFFAFVSLFIVAMTCLVLADNLILMYMGWEGVGLCSYLLIGFYYEKPAAVAAAKKAFIVNRIGDLGFALGIMLTYLEFGSVEFDVIFRQIEQWTAAGIEASAATKVIPFLLMLGAFGKSAQLPLYVWLPDAMEGPTPVSALIHAATMVTAGVYLIARMLPLFLLSPYALPTVAWVGCITALFSATIGMAQYDIKRIFAYSTVSQLGYMFMGIGVLSSVGGTFHLFTHAFFKAALFLGSGAVMHGFAGQLDLRKLSGLWRVPGWQVVTASMLVACLALAGFPLTAGFFSKDMILAQAFVTHGPGYQLLGWIGLMTAGITAYYTFRVFFRVFLGPVAYKPGEEHHGAHDDQHFHPHAPGPAINFVLIVLGLGALLAGWIGVGGGHHGWFGGMIHASSANYQVAHEAGGSHGFFSDPHKWMMLASSVVGIVGIAIAAYLHLFNRAAAERWRRAILPVAVLAEHKWCVDEGYELLIRRPLRALGHICYALGDTLIINGLVALAGWTPRLIGAAVRPLQNGRLQGYGLGMAGGAAMLVIIVWWML